jgi:hypothetical protein
VSDQTNPKDLLGVKKVAMNLLPAAGRIEGARAMTHGAAKYGPYNWREKKIIASIYLDAIERHLLAFLDGEEVAADSEVSHLGHIIANASILLDAKESGNLVDDRPKAGPAGKLLERYDASKKPTETTVAVDSNGADWIRTPSGAFVRSSFQVCPNPDKCTTCSDLGYTKKEPSFGPMS